MRHLLLSLFLTIGVIAETWAQYEGDELFDESYIHEIRIVASISLENLFSNFLDELNATDFSYAMVSVTIDGTELDSIGVRVKGGLTAFNSKKPLKLDFNEFVQGRKYDGLKKINLHQGGMEQSFMREALAYGLMRNAGLKTVRTSYTKVFFNNAYQGIYTIIEQVDDDFVKNHFASDKGTLYKTRGAELEVKFSEDNSLTYEELVSAVNLISNSDLHKELPIYVNVDQILRMYALEVFLNNVDGLLTVNGNFYIYYEPISKTYSYIPWDFNLSMYNGVNHSLFQSGMNFLFEKVRLNSVLTEQYTTLFCQLMEYNFNEDRILSIISNYEELLFDEVSNDPYINQIGDFSEGVEALKVVIKQRITRLTEDLESINASCEEFITPTQIQDVAINEIVASNDKDSGIKDPQGGASDWIELYNNTENAISLNGFYLSNNVDFLKLWPFPEETSIGGGEYLIIWADRDIDEEGLHTNFKLNKDRGELLLSYENGDVIDSLSFIKQKTNLGYARVPNGKGPFMFQATTFNGENDFTNSVSGLDENEIEVYPNPTDNFIHIRFNNLIGLDNGLLNLKDTHGKTVWQKRYDSKDMPYEIRIPTQDLSNGIYIITLANPNSLQALYKKVIVAK